MKLKAEQAFDGLKVEPIAKFNSGHGSVEQLHLLAAPLFYAGAKALVGYAIVALVLAVLLTIALTVMLAAWNGSRVQDPLPVDGKVVVTLQGFRLPGTFNIAVRNLKALEVHPPDAAGRVELVVTHHGGRVMMNGPKGSINAITAAFAPWAPVTEIQEESSLVSMLKAVPIIFGFIIGGIAVIGSVAEWPAAPAAVPVSLLFLAGVELLRRRLFRK